MSIKKIILGSAIALTAAAPAFAAVDATAAADLNLRSGPGSMYESLTVIPAGEAATIDGCVEGAEWCQVSYNGTSGWAYGPYLAVPVGEEVAAISTQPQSVTVETVTYTDTAETQANQNAAAVAGASAGALIAYAVGGPITGMIAGGILGATGAVAAVEPSEETVTYIQSNPVETVWLDGEVVVGAGIPAEVVTYETPQSELRYLNVNGQTVAVDAETGLIVRIIG